MSGLERNCREASGDCDWQQRTHKVGFWGLWKFSQCSCQCDRDRVQSQGKEVKDKDLNKEGKAEPEAK